MEKVEKSYEFTLVPDSKYEAPEFILYLTEIVEKWLPPDRRPMMRITFEFTANAITETLRVTSDDKKIHFTNFIISYLGGWRKDAKFRVDVMNK